MPDLRRPFIPSLRKFLILGVIIWIWLVGSTVEAAGTSSKISGKMQGSEWLAASATEKLAYCQKAYISFRSSPSQSYIISSNVQAITAEGFCQRLDQFYSYPINEETRLGEASALAPLLFADQPL